MNTNEVIEGIKNSPQGFIIVKEKFNERTDAYRKRETYKLYGRLDKQGGWEWARKMDDTKPKSKEFKWYPRAALENWFSQIDLSGENK